MCVQQRDGVCKRGSFPLYSRCLLPSPPVTLLHDVLAPWLRHTMLLLPLPPPSQVVCAATPIFRQ